jgi:septum formation protein
LVIVADTIVNFNGSILEKPIDKAHASRMLRNLNNNTHTVLTAVIIKTKYKTIEFVESTRVQFGNNSDTLIDRYVDSLDPLNKAGSYGYQSLGGILVKSIQGCFYNVVGLPLHSLVQALESLEVPDSSTL